MGVKVIIPPSQVITTADLKEHLGEFSDLTANDDLIVSYLLAAHAAAEHYTGYAIGSQTLELALDEFPADAIELPRGKVTSITSLKYYDESEVLQTVSAANYALDNYSIPCWLVPDNDYSWPSTLSAANAVLVRYVAGDLPDAVKAALMLMVGFMYDNRDGQGSDVDIQPPAAKALLNTVRVYSR